MALENRLTQEQALIQQQQQRLTAQQLLQVKLLEMPLAQLEENIKTELYENPALESTDPDENDNLNPNASLNEGDSIGEGEDEDFDAQTEREDREEALDSALDSIDSDDRLASDYRAYGDSNQTGAEQEEMVYGDTQSFYDKLQEQVSEEDLTDTQRQIMEYLIGSLDNDGFLRSETSFISENLAIYQGPDVTERDVNYVLSILQSFDPAGIGASTHPKDEEGDTRLFRRLYEEALGKNPSASEDFGIRGRGSYQRTQEAEPASGSFAWRDNGKEHTAGNSRLYHRYRRERTGDYDS